MSRLRSGTSGQMDGREYSIYVQFGDVASATAAFAGQYHAIALDWSGRIVGWTLVLDAVGDAQLDVRRCGAGDWASGPGALAGVSIAGTSPPYVTNLALGRAWPNPQDWDVMLPQGDILVVAVTLLNRVQQVGLTLRCRE